LLLSSRLTVVVIEIRLQPERVKLLMVGAPASLNILVGLGDINVTKRCGMSQVHVTKEILTRHILGRADGRNLPVIHLRHFYSLLVWVDAQLPLLVCLLQIQPGWHFLPVTT
jgi:hypothetical protein